MTDNCVWVCNECGRDFTDNNDNISMCPDCIAESKNDDDNKYKNDLVIIQDASRDLLLSYKTQKEYEQNTVHVFNHTIATGFLALITTLEGKK